MLLFLAVDSVLSFMKTSSAKTQKNKEIILQICKCIEPVICRWLGHLTDGHSLFTFFNKPVYYWVSFTQQQVLLVKAVNDLTLKKVEYFKILPLF